MAVIEEATEYNVKKYQESAPIPAKFLHADGTIDENIGGGGGSSNKIHLYAYTNPDDNVVVYTTKKPTAELIEKECIWVYTINDKGELVSADLYDWSEWCVFNCGENGRGFYIRYGDETTSYYDSTKDIEIDASKQMFYGDNPFENNSYHEIYESTILPKGIKVIMNDGKSFITNGVSPMSYYISEITRLILVSYINGVASMCN